MHLAQANLKVAFILTALFYMGQAGHAANPPVTLAMDKQAVTLANGQVSVRIHKRTGNIINVKYRGLEVIKLGRGGYWSLVGDTEDEEDERSNPKTRDFDSCVVRMDPARNGGDRAEVACKVSYKGKGAEVPLDMEVRYTLGRDDPGIYATCILEHRAGYPAVRLGQGRFALRLNPDIFDFYTVDARRRRVMATGYDVEHGLPLNVKEARRLTTGVRRGEVEHKYDYSAMLAQTPAYGWSSTKDHVGLWLINPSAEYLNGGPTHVDTTGHVEAILLNHMHGGHYGGGAVLLGKGEPWKKFFGPFFIYGNAGPDHDAMWRDALARAAAEQRAWPYAWVADRDYPLSAARGSLSGRIQLNDLQAPDAAASNLWVGLAAPPYAPSLPDGPVTAVDWQRDGKHYQFWTRADASGDFKIANVRPGTYTLYAFADGVLGEYSRAGVAVGAGAPNNLGTLTWTPIRCGKPLWEIGVPNRQASEFRHGDHYWQWGLYLRYPEEFPHDVNFIIGKSDWSRDWNYCQPPRIGADGKGRSTTWSITFNLTNAPTGTATLRLAICGSRTHGNVGISVNDQPVGKTGELPDSGVMHRDGITGYWLEKDIPFDAARLRAGTNVIQLQSRGDRSWTQGVLYDYLRLEVDEAKDFQTVARVATE